MTPTAPAHPLVALLRSRNPALAAKADHLIREATPLLWFTISTFPGGTAHTPTHTSTVETIARLLLPDPVLDQLNDWELYFLALACHYHDLAMAGTLADDQTPEGRDQVRQDHALRIGQIIRERWAELGFENSREAQVLAEVCRGHRPKRIDGVANWDDMEAHAVLGVGISVRLRLLSAMIYAADELHLGADRAPERVERWREIREEESRRHWRRHQAVHGPSQTRTGVLTFQINVETPGFEENLRSQVLRKAFGAVRDLRRQAEADGVAGTFPALEVQWNRRPLWDTLMPVLLADMTPRTRAEIDQVGYAGYLAETGSRTDLGDLCQEQGNGEAEVRAGIGRWAGEAVTTRRLVPQEVTPNTFVLATDPTAGKTFFEAMRTADLLDSLFLGRYHASWEDRLFRSNFGRGYVAQSVVPAVEAAYSVRMASRPPNDPLAVLLSSSPTAARLVLDYRPLPANLARWTLAEMAALTGALFDSHADPERLLDAEYRSAIRTLAAGSPLLAPTLRLLEEMALVGGFSLQEVTELHHVSEPMQRALSGDVSPGDGGVQITVTQTQPTDAPQETTGLPYLLLASQRAGTAIQLAPAADHTIRIQVAPQEAAPPNLDQFSIVEVGPAHGVVAPMLYRPARVVLNRATRTLRLYLGRFDEPAAMPVRVRLPVPRQGEDQRMTASLSTSIRWPHLTVRDLRNMDMANRMLREGGLTIELLVGPENALLAGTPHMRSERPLFPISAWEGERLRGLAGLDGDLPVPLFFPQATLAGLAGMDATQRVERWQQLRATATTGRPEVTSLVTHFQELGGTILDEVFLGFLPGRAFDPPVLQLAEGAPITQQEFEERWQAGLEHFEVRMFFAEDLHEIGEVLRHWARNSREPFPLQYDPERPAAATTRTCMALTFLPTLDRVWHVEHPVQFRLRPATWAEQHQQEAAYWRSHGDERRAALAEEIVRREQGQAAG